MIRGPATLRYGSQSIGGVVELDQQPDSRRAALRPSARFAGRASTRRRRKLDQRGCTSVEGGRVSSVDNGLEGGVLLDAGAGNFAFHADAFGRQTDDYRVPSYPYLVAPDPAELPFATQPGGFNGRQPNSATRSNEVSVGGSYLFDGGFVGVAVHAEQHPLSHPRHRRRGPRHPHRLPARPR